MDVKSRPRLVSTSVQVNATRTGGEEEEVEEKEEDLPQPVFDDEDNIFRCSICGWEVIEAQCQAPACAQEHAFVEVRSTLVVKCSFHKYSVGDGRIGMHRKSSY